MLHLSGIEIIHRNLSRQQFTIDLPSMGPSSTLCSLCKEHIFSKKAWQKFWAQTPPSHRYVTSRNALLTGRTGGCWFCSHILDDDSNLISNLTAVEMTATLSFTEGVRPEKVHEMTVIIGDADKSSRFAKNIRRLEISTISSRYLLAFTTTDDIQFAKFC